MFRAHTVTDATLTKTELTSLHVRRTHSAHTYRFESIKWTKNSGQKQKPFLNWIDQKTWSRNGLNLLASLTARSVSNDWSDGRWTWSNICKNKASCARTFMKFVHNNHLSHSNGHWALAVWQSVESPEQSARIREIRIYRKFAGYIVCNWEFWYFEIAAHVHASTGRMLLTFHTVH